MKHLSGAGFLGIGNSAFRAFTAAPAIEYAVSLAHRMARRRLEAGGAAASTHKRPKPDHNATEIVLPLDIDPVVIAQALRAKLDAGETSDALYPLERQKLGGRVVLHGRHVLRLGDGRYDKGRAFLHGLVKRLRTQRWRMRFGAGRWRPPSPVQRAGLSSPARLGKLAGKEDSDGVSIEPSL